MARTALVAAGLACILGVLWVVVCHGLGQVVLGRGTEPDVGLAPLAFPDVARDRPARILLLGTSLTANGTWAEALARDLSACRAGGVVVERLAKPGANSAWGAQALQSRLATGLAPDLMVVEFSINDSSLWRGMTLRASRTRHEEILQMARQAGVTVWLATMTPAFGRKGWERPGQVAYRALYGDLARAHGAGMIAMALPWQGLPAPRRQALMPDGLHPTEAAMEALAVPPLVTALGAQICDQG